MRASRLVALLLLLQTRGQMTAAQLARELEVSQRTIFRDVDALSASGVPIYAERGPLGGVRLVDGYRTRLTGMTPEEADALFLSGLPGPAAELGLGTVMTAARLKVLAALPSELRARASRLVERFHLDAAGWFRSSDSVPHLPALSQGVWDARRMRIGYRRGEQVVDRVVDPLGVVLKAGAWYLVAMADGQTRTYRASRVTAVELLDESFERPPGFDLAAYWADTTAAYERGVPRVEVRALVRHDRVGQLYDAVGEASTVTIGDAADGGAPAGWLPVTMTLDWPEEVAGRLLAMGADLEVIEPVDLRRRITGVAAAVAELYA
jgi:predicted DNA-binding transcriptional regulator YafY